MTDPVTQQLANDLYTALRARLAEDGFDGTLTVRPDPNYPDGIKVTITGTATSIQMVPAAVLTDSAAYPSVVEHLTRPWSTVTPAELRAEGT